MIRKVIPAILFALAPVTFLLFTTPFNQLSEHIAHINLFLISGIAMSGYSIKDELFHTKTQKQKFTLTPPLQFVVFLFLLRFIATHFMPCPYMLNPQTTQTMIDHPCSQPATSAVSCLSFIPMSTHITVIKESTPIAALHDPIETSDPRSPPFT